MIVLIPFNPTLPGGYDRLAGAINRQGRHPIHTLFVAAKEEHEDAAFEFTMKIRGQFGRHFAVTVPAEQESMLRTSNRMFVAALDALRQYQPEPGELEPVMLYFDPTWRPTKPRWLDEFQAEYYIAGAPTTFGNFDNGKVTGPVAIKLDFLKKTKLLRFLPDDVHWREFLAWEIINNGVKAEALGRVLPAFIRPFDP